MTLHRFVYKTHKWLAVGAGLFTLLWFASGIVMVMPKHLLNRAAAIPAPAPSAADFQGITVSVPQAIAAAEAAAGASVVTTGVELQPIDGRLYYQISTAKSGTHLIDAVSGQRLEITEEFAKQMATRLVGGRGPLAESETLRAYGNGYSNGPLPVLRFAFADAAGTTVFISPRTGEMSWNDRETRIRTLISGAHSFGFLRPVLANRGTRAVLILVSLVGLTMSLFGSWILWMQFQNWRARRAGRPEAA